MELTLTNTVVPIVSALVLVAVAILIFAWRGRNASTSSEIETRMKGLEAELSASRSANTDLERRLAIEETKASRLEEKGRELLTLNVELAELRQQRDTLAADFATSTAAQKAQEELVTDLRARLSAGEATITALNGRAEALASEKSRVEEELAASKSRVGERDLSISKYEEALAKLRTELDAEREAAAKLRTDYAILQQSIDSERRQADEKIALLIGAKEEMTREFKLLAGEVLHQHGETFANQNKEQLSGLLDPMRLKLTEFQQGLQVAQTEAAKEQATLKEQIRALSEVSARMTDETKNLTTALKGKAQTQGAWGELILSKILERSGLRKDQEYFAQQHAVGDDGARLRPDVIVRLPGDQSIVIDAKVSLTAFEQSVNAETEELRAAARVRHLESVRNHIKLLGGKEYHRASGSNLDFVIMFVPIEGALAAALDSDPELTEMATSMGVAISTPTTLMIALRTVANIWHVERRNRNADDIAQRAGRLYDKFVGFTEDLSLVRRHIDISRDTLTEAMNKLSVSPGNLVRQVEMLKELGAKTQKSIPAHLLENSTGELPLIGEAAQESDVQAE